MWHLKTLTPKGTILMRLSMTNIATNNAYYLLEIQLPLAFKNSGLVSGLCGNYDGQTTNDSQMAPVFSMFSFEF